MSNGRSCVRLSEVSIILKDRELLLGGIPFTNLVYLHGNLKAANSIIGEKGGPYIIDFAGSHKAPSSGEWLSPVFGSFGCDTEMMKAYFGEYDLDDFYFQVSRGLLIHPFGAGVLMRICDLGKPNRCHR